MKSKIRFKPGNKLISKEQEHFEKSLARAAADRILTLLGKMIISDMKESAEASSRADPDEKNGLS